MKYTVTKDTNLPYFMIHLSGRFSLQDIEKCYVEIMSHPEWTPGINVLWDARNCTFDNLSGEDLNMIGQMTLKYKEKRGKGKAAWVVGRDIDFAISGMFGMFNGERVVFDFRVFTSMESAR